MPLQSKTYNFPFEVMFFSLHHELHRKKSRFINNILGPIWGKWWNALGIFWVVGVVEKSWIWHVKVVGSFKGEIWVSKRSLGMSWKDYFDDRSRDLVFLSLFNFPSKLGNEVLFIMHFWGIVPYVVGIFCNCWDLSRI
jgi:hypothetical protein